MAVSAPSSTTARRLSALGAPALAAAAAAASFGIVALVDPNKPGRYPTCPFLAVTGHWCPGCGSLRAMHALSRGEVGTALGLNVLMVAALPLLAFLWFRWARRRWNGTSTRRLVHPGYLWLVLVVELVFWVVRNLPFGAALAP